MYKNESFISETATNSFIDGTENEIFYSQFRASARKYYPKYFDPTVEPAYYIRTANKFFEFTKSTPVNEYFIRLEHAPLFWIYNSPIVRYIKKFYRLSSKVHNGTGINSLLSFIEYYEKWAKVTSPEEKKYFAGLAIGIIEHKNFSKNIFIQLLNATIKIFDTSNFDPAGATDILTQTFESILNMNLEADIKNEICYYVNVFTGFSYLAQNLPDKAGYYFTGALVHKQDGINAKFYSAVTNIKQLNIEPTSKLIEELFELDNYRLQYALNANAQVLYSILCDHNIVQNIFCYQDFSPMIVELIQDINSRINRTELIIDFLKKKLIDFNHIEHMVPRNPKQTISLQTIDFIIQRYSHTHNLAFLTSLPALEEKFINTIGEIIAQIEAEFENQIQEKLSSYNILIEESKNARLHLDDEIEMTKKNIKIKVEKMIAETKEKIDEMILKYEEKIKNLELRAEFNPVLTFKNGMSYNIFFSVIVLLVAGFATYSNNNNISEISNFKNIVSSIILTGTKWGVISFIVGVLFTVIQASSAFFERNYKKQGIERKIQYVNDQRESELENIRKEGETLEVSLIHKVKEKMNFHETRIEQLKVEKENAAVDLRKQFAEQLNEQTQDLKKLLTSQ